MEEFEKQLKIQGLNYQKAVPLAQYTCTKVGGKAKYLVTCLNERSLVTLFKLCFLYHLEPLVIGGGSNLLVSDDGFDGVVILNAHKGIKSKGKIVNVKSGTRLFDLVQFVAGKNFLGMEKLLGIPGTVGGALYGNAGAYGQAASDCLERVKVFDGKKIFWLKKDQCNYGYRESLFKTTKPLLLEADFNFQPSHAVDMLSEAGKVLEERSKKYTSDLKCPGSFFKNVEVSRVSENTLSKIPKERIVFGKIPAGYLLEEVGAKGMREGGVIVSDFHANFFINTGQAKASDFYRLAIKLREKVRKKFALLLEPEVQMVGFKVNELSTGKVAVLGLGMEGKDLVNYLLRKGKAVTVFDQKSQKDLDLEGVDLQKVELVCGPDYLNRGLSGFEVVYRSAGVYRYLPELIEAEKKGVRVSSAIKLFFENCPAKIIGVTGTKGKGTTSTLVYEILKQAGKKVFLAGNIGKPILELLPKLSANDWVVLELSSFQLIDLELSPQIAVVLNITLDHLNWHKDENEYFRAKTNIVRHQLKSDRAVINYDYSRVKKFENLTKGGVFYFSKKRQVQGAYVTGGSLYLNLGKKTLLIGKTKQLLLRGEHNWENITAAVCASFLAGADVGSIKKTVFAFKGLEHRLELAGEVEGVKFYNDSFATGPQPAIAALKSFNEPLTLILGGYDKGLDYDELVCLIAKQTNIDSVLLVGDLRTKLKKMLLIKHYEGKLIDMAKLPMDRIVKEAFKVTPRGGVVLLSPAAASFDMFKDYKDRGYQFKKAVLNLS